MAKSDTASVFVLKFPAGIDNRSREHSLEEGAARTIVNLDVTRDGGVRCRDGARLVVAGDCHSMFAHPNGRYALLARDGFLCRMDADESLTALVAVMGPVAYADLNDEIYWSDGASAGRVTADGEASIWGLATPPSPAIATVDGYGMPAGTYLVAMTAEHVATGLESGAAEPSTVVLTGTSGLSVTAPGASANFRFRVYLASIYGGQDELRWVTTLDPGATTVLSSAEPDGPRLQSLLAVKPYPSTHLAAFKGRLWGASGSVVWHTSERSPHWLFPADSYYPFESSVRMLGAAEDGLYVGLADRIYYLQGANPREMTQRMVSSIGAVDGGGQALPADVFAGQGGFPSRQCSWWDVEGTLCIGKPGGVVVHPNGERYSAGVATISSSCYRAREGLRQWVSVLRADDPIDGALQAVDC